MHPEEVPLSLRNRDTSYCESFLGKRLGKQLPEDKILKFDRILLLAESIKMWDEAIQIILDLQPVPLIVPYLQAKPAKVYRPSVEDFEMALCNIHKLVKSVVTTHADLHFVKWN